MGSVYISAQEIYFCGIGVGGGGAFYLGDANGVLLNNMRPSGEVFFRYKFNGHYALKAQVDLGVAGIGKVEGVFRETVFTSISLGGEFNFFKFGAKYYEPYSYDITPYVYLGVGVALFNGTVAPTIPMAIGAKWKLADRLNMGLTWQVSKLFSDNFDGIDNPLGLNKGIWVNRDWNSTLILSISFNFLKICAPCRNGVIHF